MLINALIFFKISFQFLSNGSIFLLFFAETKGDRPGLKIYLRPTVIFSNFLPFSVQLGTVTGKYDGQFNNVEPGNQIQVLDADITKSSLKVNVGNQIVLKIRENSLKFILAHFTSRDFI